MPEGASVKVSAPKGMSIDEAKQGLARRFGVREDQVRITKEAWLAGPQAAAHLELHERQDGRPRQGEWKQSARCVGSALARRDVPR